ncbi:MAG TPA: hypothetical protein PKK06_15415 [Phycisphaerae bacterium]|nr:hypothetical protein [Phycisphaerae bacterium]HNU46720.1 hypothetical protein [Phycisphaerae bacterium]
MQRPASRVQLSNPAKPDIKVLIWIAAAALVLSGPVVGAGLDAGGSSTAPSPCPLPPAERGGMERSTTGPIMVLIDVHADPMWGTPQVQVQTYHDWVVAVDWALDQTDAHGAKISFLSTGQFMEWVLEDPVGGLPLIQRLYASGGQIGTHSHNKIRVGTHVWQELPLNPPQNLILQHWNDHIGAVNAVVTAALGVSDPAQIAAINLDRGAHVPGDDTLRIQMMADFGFTNHQQGADEQFYAYFEHYPMNPFRPTGALFLQHDPQGPIVVVPFGPVLGRNDTHFGIPQDMRVPAVQGRFLLEVLNWLHDVHVAQTGRVWVTGWAAHAADLVPGTLTHNAWNPVLDWLTQHFINQSVGGQPAATFASVRDARDAYYAWEAAHPGATSFTYPDTQTNWELYPYLVPAVTYLMGAWYEEALPAVGTVRAYRLTAGSAAGGPFTLYVAYTTDGLPAVVDLAALLEAGPWATVSPATGVPHLVNPEAVEVATIGTLLIPHDKFVAFPGTGDFDEDGDVDLYDFAHFQNCFSGTEAPPIGWDCLPGDFDLSERVDQADYAAFAGVFGQ